ncbi:MAG TPA: PEP/pyruvate-binding domain-containing protein [Deltaproteobacteria bacterium]|nr:PEP/pyruvate-binding domain-containing protein [Deltaproteobacteria bacterium]HPR54719.1 PEP/pyruvate-binding domain-containing protein [Deltaproteobacteria bacterium]HXK48272.1 PEP/pyruvate-binding domain-containing protein [Deltaproteobacteria bacterium]
MNIIIPLTNITDAGAPEVGGKAYALGRLVRGGIRVPQALCITGEAYETYVRTTGLLERISLELSRKAFHDMRWEELWDSSLRIRGMFLNTAMPPALVKKLRDPIEELFGDGPVAVRSSAPGEDSLSASFAGLHESFLNVRGIYSILDHIRLVWASLWSDAALLYRKELGLDVHHSTMAVIIQGLVAGRTSGIVFGRSATEKDRAVVEAIYGLNQGFVDGMVEPDRWTISRLDGTVISHREAVREKIMVPSAGGVSLDDLDPGSRGVPPLTGREVLEIYRIAMEIEGLFGTPQDVEWTYDGADLQVLQARPVAAGGSKELDDKRYWYRSITRSFENLKKLKRRIEDELIPELVAEADDLPAVDLAGLGNEGLAGEILDRLSSCRAWERAYWKYFIPFAHGMRLFGRVYNDTLRPHDPYEFMDLLKSSSMLSIERNSRLERLAVKVRRSPTLAAALREGRDTSAFPAFEEELHGFVRTFGDLPCCSVRSDQDDSAVRAFVLKLASGPPADTRPRTQSTGELEEYYLSFFPEECRSFAQDLLDLARASYRLRDDDNIYLGRIRGYCEAALEEGRRRLAGRPGRIKDEDVPRALRDPCFVPQPEPEDLDESDSAGVALHARQLVGQPAGSGIATGPARVLDGAEALAGFTAGEVIVCDSLDPNMTFIMPLAAGIVERKGGMLIHGAIIAREYGLPCVTGVPGAVSLIRTGDVVTVDGYLGIVVIND